MTMPILPKLAKGKPAAPSAKKPPPPAAAKKPPKPEEDETLQDEAEESPEEQDAEDEEGDEMQDAGELATAAEAASHELSTYVDRVQSIVEKAGDDHPMKQALQGMLKAAQDAQTEADAAAEEAKAAADADDVGKAADAAAKAADACERIRMQVSVFDGDDMAEEAPVVTPDKAGPGERDRAADKAPPKSPMGAWMNRYAR